MRRARSSESRRQASAIDGKLFVRVGGSAVMNGRRIEPRLCVAQRSHGERKRKRPKRFGLLMAAVADIV